MLTPEPELVTSYLNHQTSLGKMLRVVEGNKPTKDVQICPVEMIPNKDRPGKWRLTADLSSPKGTSINNGISGTWSSLAYITINQLSEIILSMGRGAYMVKADIKETCLMVPVHPRDQGHLEVRWGKDIFVNQVLPFDLDFHQHRNTFSSNGCSAMGTLPTKCDTDPALLG